MQDVESVLVQRIRRTNVKPTLIQGIVSAGLLLITVFYNGPAIQIGSNENMSNSMISFVLFCISNM